MFPIQPKMCLTKLLGCLRKVVELIGGGSATNIATSIVLAFIR